MSLVMLLAVVVSEFIARLIPVKVAAPLLQIAVGVVLSAGFGLDVQFDPHVFLLLFIPPLLFLDGWRIPRGAFFGNWKPILALAIGLVVFTVAGLGLFIHWLIPAIPIAVAFALAAILSPTDPVAVSAMTANAPLPSRLMHVLEGEALLNDATGLVCFSFAVAAALTGSFSLASASVSFLLVAGGGVLTGLAVSLVVGKLNRMLVRRAGEDPSTQVLISLLIPFAAYLAAERLHVSGVLAAAVAGIAMHYADPFGRTLALTRVQRTMVWNAVQSALNGVIFVLLGTQLPGMWRRLPEVAAASGVEGGWRLLADAALITLALGALRYLWVFCSMQLTVFRGGRGGLGIAVQTRLVAVTATAGVRGTITLAGILTLPLTMGDGAPFPARELAILLAAGVILLSLLIASIGLPLLARGLRSDLPPPGGAQSVGSARAAAVEAAVRRIESLTARPLPDTHANAERAEAAAHVLDAYRRRLDYGDGSMEAGADPRRLIETERGLRLEALRAQRDELYRLLRERSIDDETHRRLVHEIDLIEAGMSLPAS